MDKLKVRVSLTGATFDDGVGASPKLQLLRAFPVCNGQYLKSDPRKERWWTTDRVVGGRGSLMHARSDAWPVWFDPMDELLQLKLTRTSCCRLPVLTSVHCQSTNNGHMSLSSGPQRWVTFSGASRGRLSVCASLTCETPGTRVHYGMKASQQRQCDASARKPGVLLLPA